MTVNNSLLSALVIFLLAFLFSVETSSSQQLQTITQEYFVGTIPGDDMKIKELVDSAITTGELTVIVTANQSKTYGEADPDFEYTVTGFEQGDAENILTGSLSRETGEVAGEYEITIGSLNTDKNYTISIEKATFTITPRELLIEVSSGQSKVYGDTDPKFTYSANGFVSGEGDELLTGDLSRRPGEDVGVYEIMKGDLNAGTNYSIIVVEELFEITQRELTLSNFTAESRIYDGTSDVHDSGFDDNRIEGDDLNFTYQATFNDSDASNNKTVQFSNIEIAGGSAMGNYILETTDGIATADIERRSLHIAAKPVSIVYGELDPWLEWSITEGSLAEQDELTGELVRTGGMDAGRYIIEQGSLTGGLNYQITFDSAPFEISPRELSVVAETNQEKIYGENDPVFEFQVTGFAPGDDSGMLDGELDREAGEDAGVYALLPGTLNAGINYTITFEEALFEIKPKELLVTAIQGKSKIYGENDPAFDFIADGFVFDDDYELFKGRLTRNPGENVGKYNVLQGDLTAGKNYSLNFKGTSFEIIPRELTVTVDAGQRKVYGDDDPEFTFTASNYGLKDDEKIFSGSLSRMEGETAGFYEIYRDELDAGKNYIIEFREERFEITHRTLVITVDAGQSKTYGQNDPSFGYKVEGFANNDNSSILRGTLSRPEGEAAGEYPITIGNLSTTSDYRIDFNGDIFEILPKKMTVKANRGQFKYVGAEDPGLTYKASGFEFDDGVELFRGSLSREQGEQSGSYDIVRGSLDAGNNYSISFTGEAFNILMTPPVAVRFAPGRNETSVPIHTPLFGVLDQAVGAGDLDLISVLDSQDQPLPIEASIENSILWIEHHGLEYETEYLIHIPAGTVKNADGVENEDISWNFKTRVLVPPQPVVLSAPEHGQSTISQTPELRWSSSELASHYRIQLSDDQGFSRIIMDHDDVTDPEIKLNEELEHYTTYYWRIQASNSAGSSRWSAVHSFTTAAESPTLLFPLLQAEDISIAPTLEWTTPNVDKQSRLQLSTTEDFENLVEDTLLSDQSAQLTGLDDYRNYYWRVRIESEKSNSKWTETQYFRTRKNPAGDDNELMFQTSVDFGSTSTGAEDISSSDYRLMGLPGDNQYRVDDLFSGSYGIEWKAFIGAGHDKERYDEYKPGDDRFIFTPGRGFWVLSKNILDLDININHVETNENDAYTISLKPGWNIISNPHRNVVSWSDVMDINGFRGELFSYNNHFFTVDSLHPVAGYYFYNDLKNPLSELDIPYSSMQQRKEGGNQATSSGKNISVQQAIESVKIAADFGNEMVFEVELAYAVQDEISDGYVRHYPSLEMSRFGMLLSGSSEKKDGFLRKNTEYNEQGTKHTLELKGTVGSNFTWKAELNGLGSNARVLLVNPVTQRSWVLSDKDKIEVILREPHAIYDLYVGDEHFLLEKQEKMMPMEITLKPNYPNPFNPTTNIRYSIPEQQHVRLEVYDITGRRVQVIQNGIQQAGWHTLQFNGSNIASGVYFYRLSTEGVVNTGRMTLIK